MNCKRRRCHFRTISMMMSKDTMGYSFSLLWKAGSVKENGYKPESPHREKNFLSLGKRWRKRLHQTTNPDHNGLPVRDFRWERIKTVQETWSNTIVIYLLRREETFTVLKWWHFIESSILRFMFFVTYSKIKPVKPTLSKKSYLKFSERDK